MELRLKKIEEDMEAQKLEGFTRIADFAAMKLSQNFDLYFPKVAQLQEDFTHHKSLY